MDKETEKIFLQIKEEKDFLTKAKLIEYLKKDKQLRIIDISRQLNIKPSYICHLLRLNRLPLIVIDGYYSKLISLSHLFVISRIKNNEKIVSLYEKVLAENLTVASTEEEVRKIIHNTKTRGNPLQEKELVKIIEKLKNKWLVNNFKLIQTRIRSKLIIEIKGDLKQTSERIKKILEKLME